MNFLDILLIGFGFILSFVGLVGCVVPALPGTPLNFLALILLSFAKDWEPFSASFLVIMAVVAVVVSILDNVIPAWGAKKYGAEKTSVWMALAGTLVGIIFFPPFGIFIGAFVGALVGELLHGKEAMTALKAGWGVFVGTFLGIGIKLFASGIMFFYFIKEVF
ncbi:DUF456 domain-containing protein [candidate division KSB1 bacterium]|nr:DUF456 domain-containing protein [candidate division KSB1 bacterium]